MKLELLRTLHKNEGTQNGMTVQIHYWIVFPVTSSAPGIDICQKTSNPTEVVRFPVLLYAGNDCAL